jgi:plastocyanin
MIRHLCCMVTLTTGLQPLHFGYSSIMELKGIMQTGQTFRHTFNNPGTFEYYCAVHPSMVGEIVVS